MADDLIGFGDIVWGRYTSVWPTVEAQKIYNFDINCHMALRDDTASVQYNLVTKHTFAAEEPTMADQPDQGKPSFL